MAWFSKLHAVFKEVVSSLLNFAYPPFCLLCEARLDGDERHVCKTCWQGLPNYDDSGELPDDLRGRGFSHIISLWPFGDEVQKIVHVLKYVRMLSLGARIGSDLAGIISRHQLYRSADLIVPVPLHKNRFRERGYNQSALISKSAAGGAGAEFRDDVLLRVRNTKSQAQLNAVARQKNMVGAFEVANVREVKGKKVIVVDDVCTTGATLQGCCEALLAAGATQVLALTAVRTEAGKPGISA